MLITIGRASTEMRKKTAAFYTDTEAMIYYDWRCNEVPYAHPRIGIQVTVIELILTYWGVRVGEGVESSAHRGSNEGILYRDVTLSLFRDLDSGKNLYEIKIELRNRKGKREEGQK